MSDGPDFICVGVPKAGSGWLYDQLNDHPDFWMPPVKELVYLVQDFPRLPFLKRSNKPGPEGRQRERLLNRDPVDARDQAFMSHARACLGKAMDLERYATLFGAKGELLSGDVSPPYWTLEDQRVGEIARRFPATKILLLVRDPVSRAWSRISMAYRGETFDAALLDDAEGFRRYLKKTPKIGALSATQVARRWRQHAPNAPFGTFLFDDIAEHPEKARREILLFLGADPDKTGKGLAANFNRKAEMQKLAMTDTAKQVLVEHFADELREGAAQFGGAARDWPAKYGL